MVVDAVLWTIFAAAIGFIALGCRMTRPAATIVEEPSADEAIDRAA